MTRDKNLEQLLSHYSFSGCEILEEFQGGNSQIIRISASDGMQYGLKRYSGDWDRRKRSLEHEVEAHKVLGGLKAIPMPKIIDHWFEIPSMLYQWVNGVKPTDIDGARFFLSESFRSLKSLHRVHKSSKIAVDAISNLMELKMQLNDRRLLIENVHGIPSGLSQRLGCLHKDVLSTITKDILIPFDTLSFSDHGIHNLLETESGKFVFIDFEFFGNDSTSKLICDLYFHPQGIYMSKELAELNLELNRNTDLFFFYRTLLPAFALKWIYIILRRSIDWDNSLFVGSQFGAEDLNLYLEYADSLIRRPEENIPPTYIEFKNMRQ